MHDVKLLAYDFAFCATLTASISMIGMASFSEWWPWIWLVVILCTLVLLLRLAAIFGKRDSVSVAIPIPIAAASSPVPVPITAPSPFVPALVPPVPVAAHIPPVAFPGPSLSVAKTTEKQRKVKDIRLRRFALSQQQNIMNLVNDKRALRSSNS